MERDGRESLSERVTKLESVTEHLGVDFKKIDSRLDKLDDIHAKTARTETISETILQRLVTGDQQFKKILDDLDNHDGRLVSLEESRSHIEGRNGRPGLAVLQDEYLRRKTIHHLTVRIGSVLFAICMATAAWFSGLFNFFHQRP